MERFTFCKHKLTGQRLYIIDTGIIIVRAEVPSPNHPGLALETMELHEEEVTEEE